MSLTYIALKTSALENLVSDSDNENVRKQAKGALWILHGKNQVHSHTAPRSPRRRRSWRDDDLFAGTGTREILYRFCGIAKSQNPYQVPIHLGLWIIVKN